jgi:CubicO group peptidase (beta-lactamase class C family)
VTANSVKYESPETFNAIDKFVDSVYQIEIKEKNLVGGIFLMVKDNKIVYQKGFGYSDKDKKKLMYPDKTIISAASVSKLFTAAAVMQLVESNKLDLDRDINEYLTDIKVINPFPTKLTLRHILTHTSGFDEVYFNTQLTKKQNLMPLHDFIKDCMPKIVYEPGKVIAYSNYGMAFAGYIVELISKKKFEDYVKEHIFNPLDMKYSSFGQPSPFFQEKSAGYDGFSKQKIPELYFNYFPASSLTCTVNDLAKFMIASIDYSNQGKQILSANTAKLMQSPNLFPEKRMINAHGLGWFIESHSGIRTIGHDGVISGHGTRFVIIPELKMGFILYLNTFPTQSLKLYSLINNIIERFLADSSKKTDKIHYTKGIIDASLPGIYRNTRYCHNSCIKISALLGLNAEEIEVVRNNSGNLQIFGSEYLPTNNPLLWSNINDDLLFYKSGDGYIFLASNNKGFEKLSWWETRKFNMMLFVISFLLLATSVLWIIRLIVRKFKKEKFLYGMHKLFYLIPFIKMCLLITSVIVLAGTLNPVRMYSTELTSGIVFFLTLLLLFVILSFTDIYLCIKIWKDKNYKLTGRIHYTIMAIASLCICWVLNYYNLIGYNF